MITRTLLRSIPRNGPSVTPHLPLQLQHAVQQGLGSRGASGNVDINWHNSVAASDDGVRVVVVSTTVGAGSHRNNPTRVRHLIVDLPQCGCHLVCQSSGDDHDIGLTRRCSENDTETILIVSGSSHVHHLNSATGETEGHWPHGTLSGPVDCLVKLRQDPFSTVLRSLQAELVRSLHCHSSDRRRR